MPDDFLILLARLPSAIVANERIISQLLYVIMKRDVDALQFCDIMKTLVGYSAQALQFLDNLKQGAVFFLKCVSYIVITEFVLETAWIPYNYQDNFAINFFHYLLNSQKLRMTNIFYNTNNIIIFASTMRKFHKGMML